MPARRPLRYTMPVLIFTVGALLLAGYFFLEWRMIERRLYDDAEHELQLIAGLTGGDMEAAFRLGRAAEARAAIERIGADRRVALALLVDSSGKVLFSSRRVPRYEHVQETSFARFEEELQADHLGLRIAQDRDKERVFGMFPVAIRRDDQALLPQMVGWLMIDYDLSRSIANVQRGLMERMLPHAMLLLVLCIGLWWMFRRLLLLRINRLIAATRAIAKGDFTVRPDISGNDEIADLAREFRGMTKHLQTHAEEISFLAEHDSMTGLYNRPGLEALINVALQGVRLRRKQYLVMQVDIENFRVINDTQGHAAGDELLRSFGQLLVNTFPDAVAIARLAGDEFAILIELVAGTDLDSVSRRLQGAVANYRFEWKAERFGVQIRAGMVRLEAEMVNADQVLAFADIAYHAARDRGHERIALWDPSIEDMAHRHGQMRWVSRIQSALDEDRFELHAQKIMPISEGDDSALHMEILVRMCDESGDLVPPGEFLGAAERYNLVGQIDRWVIKNTFRCLRRQMDILDQLGMCTINLSGLSFGNPAILMEIREELANSYGLPPSRFCFEVTETAAITHLGEARKFIEELRALGCSFALDDFGSGVSSFGYLKNLPVDFVKIDGMFVRDILNDPADRAIVASINEIAHKMGKKTIAEFAESKAVIDELRRIGVDYAQGYGVARPVPLSRLLGQLVSGHRHVSAK